MFLKNKPAHSWNVDIALVHKRYSGAEAVKSVTPLQIICVVYSLLYNFSVALLRKKKDVPLLQGFQKLHSDNRISRCCFHVV